MKNKIIVALLALGLVSPSLFAQELAKEQRKNRKGEKMEGKSHKKATHLHGKKARKKKEKEDVEEGKEETKKLDQE